MKHVLLAVAVAAAPLLATAPAGASDRSPEGTALARALSDVRRDDWAGARSDARGVGRDIVEWHRLRAGKGDWADYLAFLRRNPDWPGLDLLRTRGERVLPAGADPAQVVAYFAGQPPETGEGAVRLIEAYEALGQKGEAAAQAVLSWRTQTLGTAAESRIFTRYGETLEPHHEARLDMLLWRRQWDHAARMLPRVPAGWAALAAARRALAEDQAGVDTLIARVPETLADNAGLAYERFEWRARKGRQEDAIDLMLERSTSASALGQPQDWADRRSRYARQLMRDGHAEAAYRLASQHFLAEGSDYSDLEWLSGYVALRYLKDPELALIHFGHLQEEVQTPISMGRAGYWRGRALEALGREAEAQAAYAEGGQFQTSFYGLLAAEKAGLDMDPTLTGAEAYPDWRDSDLKGNSVIEAARLLHEAGEVPMAARFLRHLGESLDAEGLQRLAGFAMSLDDPYLALKVGKGAADQGVVLPQAYYPMHELARTELPVPTELALSIARRESEFYVSARSGVGARGLMQLMPGTAKEMAAKTGQSYDLDRLSTDPAYNATLGSAYLAQLIDEFGPAYALVAAGYNAGPGRPRSWIRTYGDPRSAGVDPVDWVEHIPFDETRNYVMRVVESLPVYRARLTGETGPLSITSALRGS